MKAKIAALCLCAAMLTVSLYAVAPARALDTQNTWFVDIRGGISPPMTTTFYDVDWTPDGKYAMFVGADSGIGVAWWYDPSKTGDAAWTQALLVSPSATQFKCVEWDSIGLRFIIIGDAISGYWYYVNLPGAGLVEMGPDADLQSVGPYIEDMTFVSGTIYAAGRMAIMGYVFAFDCTSWDWTLVAGSTISNANWYAIEYYPSNGRIYCAGSDGGSNGVYASYSLPSGPYTIHSTPSSMIYTDMALDTFDYDRMILTTKNRALNPDAIYEASGTDLESVVPLYQLPTEYHLNAIEIQADGFAVAVGQDSGTGNGLVYDIWWTGATTSVMKRSVTAPPFSGQNFQGVSIRPTGVQMALVAGSSFKYSYTSVVGPIQVDTGVPHFNYIDIYPLGGTLANSFINGQTDVDIGDSMTQYVLQAEIYDPLGWDRMTTLEAWLWYDFMATNTDLPISMGAGFDAAGGENQRMHFTIDDASVAVQVYPPAAPGTDETTLNLGLCSWTQLNGTSVLVQMVFSPHQQVRYAPGGFTQAVGDRYGMGPEGQSVLAALDSANTWDIKMSVTDDAPTPNEASAFDEFGFYKYTYLGAAGIPNGGAVYGSGAPNTNNVVMTQSGDDVEFCSNCPYTLTVTLASALAGVAEPANTIPGTDISVRGGELAAENFFGAAGSTITMIGGPQVSRMSERTTTTSSWDDDELSFSQVIWEVNIPGVPEDSYVSTITWALTN